jgi:DNA-binding MarR family transcriptional regulator
MLRAKKVKSSRSALHQFYGLVIRDVMGNLSAMIQSYDLSPAQISTLFRLREQGSLLVSSISEQLKLSSGTTSHLVERLVQRNMVSRVETSQDRRQRLVQLTKDGEEFLADFDQQVSLTITNLVKDVPDEIMLPFTESLKVLMTHLLKS